MLLSDHYTATITQLSCTHTPGAYSHCVIGLLSHDTTALIAAFAASGKSLEDLPPADQYYLSDDYKRTVIQHMGVTQLIDIILINPTVTLTPSYRDTGFTASYSFQPLSNLVYTRDQQITTCKGIVMGRLRSEQRQREVELMKFCFNKLGMHGW